MEQICLFNYSNGVKIEKVQKVIHALNRIRIHVLKDEWSLHEQIKMQLEDAGIAYGYEHKLGCRNRVDFLTDGGIGIEAKKGRPNQKQVLTQLNRYAEFNNINALVLVVERYMDLPEYINEIPCYVVGLNKLWGIASK